MLVPTGAATSLVELCVEAANSTWHPTSESAVRVFKVTSATAAIEASASPLNPKVVMSSRSSAVAIFDVACLSKQSTASSGVMPLPLSITWMRVRPESLMITVIWSAPASTAFSTSSFTTDAGLCTTSPAAIIFAMFPGSILSSIYSRE